MKNQDPINVTIRKATASDLPFLIESIVESEKSGSDIFPYNALLGIDIPRFSQILTEIFDEEIPNHAWCLDHWYVAEYDGILTAALSAWIEGIDGSNSDLIKSQLLHYYFSEEWAAAAEKLQVISSVSIPRLSGYLQLEHLYTHPNFRGKGLMKKLLFSAIHDFPGNSAEIQLLECNQAAVSLYSNIGFSVHQRQCNEAILRLSLLSGDCKLQMTKNHE